MFKHKVPHVMRADSLHVNRDAMMMLLCYFKYPLHPELWGTASLVHGMP